MQTILKKSNMTRERKMADAKLAGMTAKKKALLRLDKQNKGTKVRLYPPRAY